MNAWHIDFSCSTLLFLYFFFPSGCMRDVRLNGRYMPLDSQPRDGVSQVKVQGLSKGCSSDSCKKNQCSPPFTCVDLWRVHECRYTLRPVHTNVAPLPNSITLQDFTHTHMHPFQTKTWRLNFKTMCCLWSNFGMFLFSFCLKLRKYAL